MLEVSHLTDSGRKRDHNEDSYLFDESLGIYIVCDGMGGHAAGEIASQMACEAIMKHFKSHHSAIVEFKKSSASEGFSEQKLKIYSLIDDSIAEANKVIFERAQKEPEKKGMGTTLVLAIATEHGVFVAHVGDSRAYLIRKGQLKQLTEDHSLVNEMIAAGMVSKEEAHNHPQGNVITKALGIQSAVVGDCRFFETMEGDAIFLCSDGLHDYFSQNQALDIYHHNSIKNLAKSYIDFANKSGGKDNITCIVLQFGDKEAPPVHPEKVTADSKIQVLKKIPLFSSLNYKEISLLLEFIEVVDFKIAQNVITENEYGDEMFVILKGELGVFYENSQVNSLKPGQFFGEMALIDKAKRSATIQALAPSKLMRIHRDKLFPLLKKEPKIGVKIFWAFLQNMNKRLRDNDKVVAELYEERKK